jgi:hypothetical protein
MPSKSSGRTDVLAGVLSGTTQAMLLNPWDRALYLSITHRRPFLTAANFSRPYMGFAQAAVQRVISSGLYFVLQHQAEKFIEQRGGTYLQRQDRASDLLVGMFAGSLNGLLLNPLASIKYYAWSKNNAWSWSGTTAHMWQRGGLLPFVKGAGTTAMRDMVCVSCL